jgi:hypothetical protein
VGLSHSLTSQSAFGETVLAHSPAIGAALLWRVTTATKTAPARPRWRWFVDDPSTWNATAEWNLAFPELAVPVA